jgi:hypothetical protein
MLPATCAVFCAISHIPGTCAIPGSSITRLVSLLSLNPSVAYAMKRLRIEAR